MDWLKAAVDSYKELLVSGLELYGNKEKAIIYANNWSCSGNKAKEIALSELKWI